MSKTKTVRHERKMTRRFFAGLLGVCLALCNLGILTMSAFADESTNLEYNPKSNPIMVIKTWEDDNNSQNKRPVSVKMTLMLNGKELETIELAKNDATKTDTSKTEGSAGENSNDWTSAFIGTYPMYDEEGNLYTYDVVEEEIENYVLQEKTSEKNEYEELIFKLTNAHKVEETEITTPEEPTIPTSPKTSDSRTAAGYALTTLIALAVVAAFFRRKRIVK